MTINLPPTSLLSRACDLRLHFAEVCNLEVAFDDCVDALAAHDGMIAAFGGDLANVPSTDLGLVVDDVLTRTMCRRATAADTDDTPPLAIFEGTPVPDFDSADVDGACRWWTHHINAEVTVQVLDRWTVTEGMTRMDPEIIAFGDLSMDPDTAKEIAAGLLSATSLLGGVR